jgi:hypothetical protein
MEKQIENILIKVDEGTMPVQQALSDLLLLFNVMPSLPIDRWDAEDWLGKNKDIWNHPRVTDRNNKESYEVADLMAEYANWLSGNKA